MRTLDALRRELDQIDGEMLALLEKRLSVAREIAQVKKASGLPVCDPARERDMMAARLSRVTKLNQNGAEQMIRLLVRISKETQAQCMEDEGQ